MSRKNQEFLKMQNDRTSKRLNYREPTIYSLGYLEQVESYYNGAYYDGPHSSYYYDG